MAFSWKQGIEADEDIILSEAIKEVQTNLSALGSRLVCVSELTGQNNAQDDGVLNSQNQPYNASNIGTNRNPLS